MNSISSRPSLMESKNPTAAEVARATFHIVHDSKAADESYVLRSVGGASTLSFVIAKTAL